MQMKNIKSYSELSQIISFRERFEYLKIGGIVGQSTFGGHRKLNQILYTSQEWKDTKRKVIIRDNGYDMGLFDYPIKGAIYVHHINPITIEDIIEKRDCIFDLENLISVSFKTHNAIHYGDFGLISGNEIVIRTKNDTCLWRNNA